MRFFWDFDDFNDIEREWTMFIVNLLAVIFTAYCLIKTARFHGKVLFELLPLSINTIATIILLFIKLFEKGYQFDLIAFVIEIFTYFLFCYTFSLLHSRILQKHNLPVQKVCNGLLLFLAGSALVVIILVLTSTIERNCDNNLIEASLVCFATEVVSYIPTVYFGIDIFKNLDKKHKEEQQQINQNNDIIHISGGFETVSDTYIRQRKNQIKLVLGGYTISLVLRALVLAFSIDFDSYFTCTDIDGIHILTSDQFMGQLLLVLIEINQLIPHLIIPIAFFIIPVSRHSSRNNVNLEQTLLQQDQEDNNQDIQRRITDSIVRSSIKNAQPDSNSMLSNGSIPASAIHSMHSDSSD